MTKFLSKLFLCGILLSSVNGYCQEKGLFITSMGGTPISASENVTINNSTCNIVNDYETHYDIVVGSLIDCLEYNDTNKSVTVSGSSTIDCAAGNVIVAKNFPYATATTDPTDQNNITWKETYGSDTVIPISNTVGYYYLNQANNDKIYKVTDANKTTDTHYTSGEVYTKDSEQWKDKEGNTVPIKVINLKDTTLGFTKDADNNNILFNGNVAYNDGGTWKLLPGGTQPLSPAVLEVTSGKKLTIGDKQTVETSDNNGSAQLTVTQLGSIKGPATIELLNDGYTGDTQNQWETSVVLEPGSVVGDSADDKKVSISNGTVDLSSYITMNTNNKPVFNTTDAGKLHLTLNSTVNLFNQYLADINTNANILIKNFNSATIPTPPLFNDVTSINSTGKITVNVPYVLSDGTNSYASVPSDYINDLTSDTTISFNPVKKTQISGLFKSGANINYVIDAKNILKDLISTLKDQNNSTSVADSVKTITINAAAFKILDKTIDFKDGDFQGYNKNDKKFNIVINQTDEKVSELEVESTVIDTDTIAEVYGSLQPADTYKEPDMSSADGPVKSQYNNIDKATIVPNTANNSTNNGKGPDTTISNSNAKIALTGDTKMKSLTITGTSDIVTNGNGQKLQVGTLSINKDSKVKVVGTELVLG